MNEDRLNYGYTCFKLLPFTRTLLLEASPPKYGRVLADHVTYEFNVPESAFNHVDDPIRARAVECYGYIDTGDGLECYLVTVDGHKMRPDGHLMHITWSVDPAKYKPFMSNNIIELNDYVPTKVPFKLGALCAFVPHNK